MRTTTDRAVFFDLDGVLADSGPMVAEVAEGVLGRRGLTLEPERLRRFAGPPLRESFVTTLESTGIAESELDTAVDECVLDFRSHYRERFLDTPAFAGVREMLEAVGAIAPIAVATSKPLEFAVPLLDQLDLAGFFTTITAPQPDWPADDKTTILRTAIDAVETSIGTELRVPRCTMVGDREHDVVAARAVGMAVVAVTWGIGTRAELDAAAPDRAVDHPADVLAAIESIGNRSG